MKEEIKVKPGQRWQEMDNRFTRFVEVVEVRGDRVVLKGGSRLTEASLKRFNGRSKGYKLVVDV